MKNIYPKISVIVICYNQEDVIKRALVSVVIQKDYLHELIISDDHSSDKTWEIVTEYKKKHPDIIKAYRQEQNLGVYENLQSTYDKVTGEMVFFLSGDDAFGPELFKKTCETLAEKNLDYQKDKYCVITDYKKITPDGEESVITKNSLVLKNNPFSLKFRGIIVNRALGKSISVFNEMKRFTIKNQSKKGPSSLQEGITDIMPFYLIDKIFYLPVVGNIYYSGIGVSQQINKNKKMRLVSLIEYCNQAPNYFRALNRYDRNWLRFHKVKSKYLLNPALVGYLNYFYRGIILSFDPFRKFFIIREMKTFLSSSRMIFKAKQ